MTPTGLERSFSDFVARNRLVSASDRVIAAVSGGVDSMVMLRLLCLLRGSLGFALSVAHVNHGLRGPESDGDEEFVREAARALGLEFHLHRSITAGDPRGARATGIQERARADRYGFFESLRAGEGACRLATAHHRDDNAETVLFNFLRGSGVHGLTGIPVKRSDGFIIRPLLFATRAEIRRYAEEGGVAFREDSSNTAMKYTRNALRLGVIPSIEALVNPGVRETLSRASDLFTDLESYVAREVERVLPQVMVSEAPDEVRLGIESLGALPMFLRESLLLAAARRFNRYGIGYAHVRALLGLVDAQSGSSCTLPGSLRAEREREHLVLRCGPAGGGPFSFPVVPGESYDFGDFAFSSRPAAGVNLGSTPFEEYVDADRLLGEGEPGRADAPRGTGGPGAAAGLRLRSWKDGDWFIPFGMRSKKKLSDFFTDRKLSLAEKSRIPILTSGPDVVWVCGERLDERFRLTPGTKRILLLRYDPSPR